MNSKSRNEKMEQLALLRLDRRTFDEAAEKMGIPRRTLVRWAATTEYKETLAKLRDGWKEEAETKVGSWAWDVITSLYELSQGHGIRSELVRYHAAAKLADIFGLGIQVDRQDKGDAKEMDEVYKALKTSQERLPEQKVTVNVWLPSQRSSMDLPIEPIELKDDLEAQVRELPLVADERPR